MDILKGVLADKAIDYINRVSDVKKCTYIDTNLEINEILLKVDYTDTTNIFDISPDKSTVLSLPFTYEMILLDKTETGDYIYPEVYLGNWAKSNKLDLDLPQFIDICSHIEDKIMANIENDKAEDEPER